EYDSILLITQYGWKLENLFDTMWAARILGMDRYGLANLLDEAYGIKLNKKYQKANWCRRPLSPAQLNYAQMDTHFLLRLRDDLAEKLTAEGRMEEAREIFAEQTQVRPSNREFNPHGFWGIGGVRELPPRKQAVVQAVYIFRDDQAKRLNRPHFKVFGDQTIIELADKLPKNREELNGIHGMSARQISRYGPRLIKIVQQSQNSPAPKRPRNNKRRSKKVSSRYDKLHLWRKERARARGVESDVIISRDALWELARKNPRCAADLAQISLLGPWRRENYGGEILEILAGS
ncbi:MAG: ribonuclease D, partial [Candidatus Promineifilaceae bacterium]